MTIHNDIEKVLVTEEEIAEKTKELGNLINEEYAGKNPLLVCILRGASIFMSDLVRQIDIPLEFDFMSVSSYGSALESSGEVRIEQDLEISVKDRHVILVEDIVDTGNTLQALMDLFEARQAASIGAVTLLSKPSRREVDVDVKWSGYTIPNEFAVGYGLDFENNYRHLPYIGVLKEEIYR